MRGVREYQVRVIDRPAIGTELGPYEAAARGIADQSDKEFRVPARKAGNVANTRIGRGLGQRAMAVDAQRPFAQDEAIRAAVLLVAFCAPGLCQTLVDQPETAPGRGFIEIEIQKAL